MTTHYPPTIVARSSLPAGLTKLAQASDRFANIQEQLNLLTEQEPAVQRYVALQAELTQAHNTETQRHRDLCDLALSLYDGARRLHADVTIDCQRAVAIADSQAALLWLFCHHPDAFQLDEVEQLSELLRRCGLRDKLVLSRQRLLDAVDAVFSQTGYKISGWVVQDGMASADAQWQHHIVDEFTRDTALKRVEQTITCTLTSGLWHWREAPTIERHAIQLDFVSIAEPTTRPIVRIRQKLTHHLATVDFQNGGTS